MYLQQRKTPREEDFKKKTKIVTFKIKRPTTIHRCFLSYQMYTCGISHKLSTCAYLYQLMLIFSHQCLFYY